MDIRPAGPEDVAELADVAAATFPLACPPSTAPGDIAAFVATHLSEQCFSGYLTDPDRTVLIATVGRRIVGYTVLIRDGSDVELSKMYVLADHHRTGAAAALMQADLSWAANRGARAVWLGVNQGNERAQGFYRRPGFAVTGTRTFQVGDSVEQDYLMARSLDPDVGERQQT